MKKIFYKIIPIALMIFMAAPMMMSHDKATGAVSLSDKRKAEYYFLEAQNEKSHDRIDSYYDLIKRAHEIDPTNTTYSFYLAYCNLSMPEITRTMAHSSLDLMKEHFDACPGDYYESLIYSDAQMMLGNAGEGLRAIKELYQRNPYRIELQVRLAEAYARAGDYKASNETYDSIAAIHGKSTNLTLKKVSNYISVNDTVGALNEMRSLLLTAPRNVEYNISMGSIMQQFNMPDSALYYLNVAQEAEPNNGYTYLAKAQYYMLNGDTTQYENQIQLALVNEKLTIDDKMELLVTSVKEMIQQQDTTGRADTLFNVLIKQHPHEAIVHEMYSEYLSYKGNYKAAAEEQGYVMDLNPTDANGWKRLMIVQMMAQDYPAAIKSADKALEYNPDSVELYKYIAPIFSQMKEYDKAIETYSLALSLADTLDVVTMSDLKGGMADVYHELGEKEKAYKLYDEAIELNPFNVGTLNNYAYFLSLDGNDLDKAERMAGFVVNTVPNNATYLDTYAWVYFKKKDYKMALMYIKSALDNDDSHSADLYDHYGDILFMNGEKEEAVKQWKTALEKDPENELIQKKVKFETIFSE